MMRLMLALLVVAGMAYWVLTNGGDETQTVDVQYKQQVNEIKGLEQQMLQDAQDLQKKADAMAQ